jgi:hypothetical protein
VLRLVDQAEWEVDLEDELLAGARSAQGVHLGQLSGTPFELVLGLIEMAHLRDVRPAGAQQGGRLGQRVDAADQGRLVGVDHPTCQGPDLDPGNRTVTHSLADDGVEVSQCGRAGSPAITADVVSGARRRMVTFCPLSMAVSRP